MGTPNGYPCPNCGQFVYAGSYHVCPPREEAVVLAELTLQLERLNNNFEKLLEKFNEVQTGAGLEVLPEAHGED